MKLKLLLIIGLSFFLKESQAQSLELFNPNKQWILVTNKIEKKELRFIEYDKSKVELNTMIWRFLPGGFIEYDYQSDENIFACQGVDFIDLDLSECRWKYTSSDSSITLLIKGGYASIDDFVFKRKYLISIDDSDKEYAFLLTKDIDYFFNDLTKKSKR